MFSLSGAGLYTHDLGRMGHMSFCSLLSSFLRHLYTREIKTLYKKFKLASKALRTTSPKNLSCDTTGFFFTTFAENNWNFQIETKIGNQLKRKKGHVIPKPVDSNS